MIRRENAHIWGATGVSGSALVSVCQNFLAFKRLKVTLRPRHRPLKFSATVLKATTLVFPLNDRQQVVEVVSPQRRACYTGERRTGVANPFKRISISCQ